MPKKTAPAPEKRILRMDDVKAATGLSRSTLYDHIRRGLFPRPVPLGPKARGWLAEEIEAWKAARVAEREDAIAA